MTGVQTCALPISPDPKIEIPNYNKRGFSYNKYQNNNNVKSSIYDTEAVYKNYFQNMYVDKGRVEE